MSDLRKSTRLVTAPAFEPVTLDEAKLWCRVDDDDTDQDAMLILLIIAMREHAEEITGRAFVKRTLELRLNCFPAGEIELPLAPLQAVTSVTYVDSAGTLQNLDGSPSQYQVDTVSEPGVVAPLHGESWPSARGGLGDVRIQYIAGYPNVNSIPKRVRLWTQARIATLYENREQLVVGGTVLKLPHDFTDGLLDRLRVTRQFA